MYQNKIINNVNAIITSKSILLLLHGQPLDYGEESELSTSQV